MKEYSVVSEFRPLNNFLFGYCILSRYHNACLYLS